jgi:hypothetical protein
MSRRKIRPRTRRRQARARASPPREDARARTLPEAGAAAAVLLLLAAPAPALDIEGTWYVLVHYRDLRSGVPEQDQWEDRILRFEREGADLRFREYPLVLFADESGRFERSGGEPVRVVGAWQPTPEQQREIAAGLRVDPRDAREKRLRPTATGFSSSRSAFDCGGPARN